MLMKLKNGMEYRSSNRRKLVVTTVGSWSNAIFDLEVEGIGQCNFLKQAHRPSIRSRLETLVYSKERYNYLV